MRILWHDATTAALAVDDRFLRLLRERHVYQAVTGETSGTAGPYRDRFREGETLTFLKTACLEPFSTIDAGQSLFSIGSFTTVRSALPINVSIGRYCSIGPGVSLVGYRHPLEAVSTSSAVFNPHRDFVRGYLDDALARGLDAPFRAVPAPQPRDRMITIGHDVWIGEGCVLAGGISIGHGAVVAARSIVTRDVEPYVIVGGPPAAPIRQRFPFEVAARLHATRWWDFELSDLHGLPLSDPSCFCDAFDKLGHTLRRYRPAVCMLWDEVRSHEEET